MGNSIAGSTDLVESCKVCSCPYAPRTPYALLMSKQFRAGACWATLNPRTHAHTAHDLFFSCGDTSNALALGLVRARESRHRMSSNEGRVSSSLLKFSVLSLPSQYPHSVHPFDSAPISTGRYYTCHKIRGQHSCLLLLRSSSNPVTSSA